MIQKDPNAKEGMRVMVKSMIDDPNPVPAGTQGTIFLIDATGTLHVRWDDGRKLGLIPGIDAYILEPEEFSDLMDNAFGTIDEVDSGKNAIKNSINQTPSNIKKSMPSVPNLSKTNVAKNFKAANIKDVKVESNEIKGGKADKLSIKDLVKKHKVSVEDIKKEIKIGVKIEKEHVGDDVNKAKEIAMDHISEFPDYYSNKRYGVLASEKGLKKSKKKKKEKKTDYMTSTAGGVSTGAYTGNAWGSGPLTNNKEVAKPGQLKEMTYTPDDDISDTSVEAWADKNRDGWKWNDTPIWDGGEIIDPLAKIKTSWDDENLDISKDWDKVQKKKNLKKEDVLKMVGMKLMESEHKIVNDKDLDSIKDNFKPPIIDDEDNFEWAHDIIDNADEIMIGDMVKCVSGYGSYMGADDYGGAGYKPGKKFIVNKILKVGHQTLGPNVRVMWPESSPYGVYEFALKKLTPNEVEEEQIDETTTFGSVWGPNGPPVGPAFAAKQGQWRAGKNPIWKGGKIVQKVENSGILNPITENKIEIGDKVKIKKEYGGGSGKVVEINKSYVVVKTSKGNKSYHMSDLITEANKVKYNPGGKIVQIKKKCTKYPYCSQGAVDDPLKLSDKVSQPGTYVETELSDDTIKNIHEVSKQTGKPFIEIYNLVKENIR
jgi:hypothetical protein